MQKEKKTYLYVSFWDICLENLPVGNISHKLLSAEEAAKLIYNAKRNKQLFCVASDESSSEREQLCKVLMKHCGVDISGNDFLHKWGTSKKFELGIVPLNAVEMEQDDQFLVITNYYTFSEKKDALKLVIAADTIEFHLFQPE